MLLLFSTTYLCEAGFSSYNSIKMKYQNRLNGEADMRIQLSSNKPDTKEILSQYYFPYDFFAKVVTYLHYVDM